MLSRRPALLIALVAALVLGAGVTIAYIVVKRQPGNVLHPGVRFEQGSDSANDSERMPPRFTWPLYGYSKDHTRVYDTRLHAGGRWRAVWRHRSSALVEFPPVIYRDAIFQLAGDGRLVAMSTRTGRVRWRRRLGTLAASSPAVSKQRVYVTLLRRRGSEKGRVVALSRRTGRIEWARNLPSRSESSPLLHRSRLYFGTENGTLYCLSSRSGRIVWRYHASGAIKGSPTLRHGKLFFGDYGGHVQAVRVTNGRRVWDNDAAVGSLRSGEFYATAAVAFGRVYIGSTDGREYSFSTGDGKLAWARQTGKYVYASAAVRDVRGLGPTVFFGSYDGKFYALNARFGKIRWTRRIGGRISGGATIIGDTVFFADLKHRRTYGLNTRTGRVVFRRRPGLFDPVISDGRHLFLTGSRSLQALLPAREVSAAERKRRALRTSRRRLRPALQCHVLQRVPPRRLKGACWWR